MRVIPVGSEDREQEFDLSETLSEEQLELLDSILGEIEAVADPDDETLATLIEYDGEEVAITVPGFMQQEWLEILRKEEKATEGDNRGE